MAPRRMSRGGIEENDDTNANIPEPSLAVMGLRVVCIVGLVYMLQLATGTSALGAGASFQGVHAVQSPHLFR